MTAMNGDAPQEDLSPREKWGILGGSFDPVHNGHLHLAAAALEELSLAKVLLIPARTPPHKLTRRMASTDDRLNMLRLALSGEKSIVIDEVEIARGGISFTYETLTGLAGSHGETDFYFLVGNDSLAELATWRRIDLIAGLVTFVVLRRSGRASTETPPELIEALAGNPLRTVILAAKPMDVSSTEIRRAVARGDSIEDLVPPPVADYIREQGLYR